MKTKKMIKLFVLAIAVFAEHSCSKSSGGGGGVLVPQPPVDKNWTFESTPIWADEFDVAGAPNTAKWGYDIGGSGWGNNELQYYTNALNNAKVQDGKLVITAIKES